VDASEIAPDLWRWTGLHPEWKREVACTYLRSPGAIVLVDPLIPPEDGERFLRHLDEDEVGAEADAHPVDRLLAHA
jgi:hypothetical protein